MTEKLSVITVHGINSDGDWQEEIRSVLEPHFNCINLKYREYRKLGPLKLLVGAATLLVLVGVALQYALVRLLDGHWHTIGVVLCLGLLVLTYIEAIGRRRRLVTSFKRDLDISTGGCMERPHVIGHSLGTFLLAQALLRYDEVKFDRIVLAGCVLPSAFDWEDIHINKGTFSQVRNEIGRKDWTARLAGIIRLPIWGLGNAGWAGFRQSWLRRMWRQRRQMHTPIVELDRPFIHTHTGWETCSFCYTAEGCNAGVHNVWLPQTTHSDHFIGIGHARQFWLPFLWGIDPVEYRLFHELCILLGRYESVHDRRISGLENTFGSTVWSWLGCSLNESLTSALEEIGQSRYDAKFDQLKHDTMRAIWQSVCAAESSFHRRNGVNRLNDFRLDQRILALNPYVALSRAINQVVLPLARS